MWRLKPAAPAQFAQLGALAIPLMIGVAASCAAAAVGFWRRERWGHRLAMTVVSISLLGDTLNAGVRGDWRTLIGWGNARVSSEPYGAAVVREGAHGY
jgi:hypothetical protein